MSTPTPVCPSNDCENVTEAPEKPFQVELQAFFRRLILKKDPVSPSQVEESGSSTLGSTAEAVGELSSSSGHTRIPRAKLSALDRLKKLGSRKGKEKATAHAFPPEEWGIDEPSAFHHTHATIVSEGAEEAGQMFERLVTKDLPPTPSNGPHPNENEDLNDQKAENMTLAKRIQQLLTTLTSSLPTQAPWPVGTSDPSPSSDVTASQTSSSNSSPNALASDLTITCTKEPTPNIDTLLPPPPTIAGGLVQDKSLISLLSSATVMNGSLAKGKESVFSILDRLRFPLSRNISTSDALDSKGEGTVTTKDSETQETAIEGSEDVMLYAPLEPHPDSEIEIAESEIISLSGDADEEEHANPPGPMESIGKEKTEKKFKEKVIWVPSPTKISVQATWWGYRIYLPPPVLRVLNNKSIEAAKRAALLTTALKWLLDHIPLTLLPPQVRPAATLLRTLVPLLGYIGSFVAWSWSAVRTFDKGHGVILSATWLLPVALIPGSWDENEVPVGGHVLSVNPAHPVSTPGAASRST